MNYIYETEGKNRVEAEKRALEVLQLDASAITFKPVSQRGLLGLVARKPVVLRAYPNSDKIAAESIISGVILTIIKKMGMHAEVEHISEVEGNIVVELHSDDSRILIGKQGRTLDALQFVLNLMIDSKLRDGKRIMIDVAEYRSRRQKRLVKLAQAVADRVSKTGRSVLLEYMNPYDRRIVHLALEEDDRVYTKSDGTGVYKRVRVIPESREEEDEDQYIDEYGDVNGNVRDPDEDEDED